MKQLLVVGLGAALLAACGPAPQPPAPPAPPSPAATQPASTPAPTGGQAPGQPPPAGGQGPNFLQLMGGARNAAYKVTYRMSGAGAGQGTSVDQTWYIKPPKSRWDMGSDMSIYVLEDGFYQCTRSGGTATCLQLGPAQGGLQSPGFQAQMEMQDKPDQFNPTYQGTRQIAGQQAHCYALNPAATLSIGQGTFCFSSQGVMLLMEARSQGSEFRMEATSYSTSVSDGDFTLPARPTQLPAIPGLPGGLPGGQLPPIPGR